MGLDEALMIAPQENKLQINFPTELFTILKEAKHLLAMQGIFSGFLEDMETNIQRIFEKRDDFWNQNIKLIKIEECYNGIQEIVRSCEKKLIRKEIDEIEDDIKEICSEMTWKQHSKL